MWMVRACVTPLFISLGSVFLWASEGTATDIVKDSTVAVYLLDFDAMFYEVLPSYYRRKFEESPGPAVAAGRTAAPIVMDVYKVAYWSILSWIMLDLLVYAYSDQTEESAKALFWSRRFFLQSEVMKPFRAGVSAETEPGLALMAQINLIINTVHAVANAYFVWTSAEHSDGLFGALVAALSLTSDGAKRALKAALILVCVGSMIAMAFMPAVVFSMYATDYSFGLGRFFDQGTAFYHCITQYGVDQFCASGDLDEPWGLPPAAPPPPWPPMGVSAGAGLE